MLKRIKRNIIHWLLRKRAEGEVKAPVNYTAAYNNLKDALNALNVAYKQTEQDEETSTIEFFYQGGFFVIECSNTDEGAFKLLCLGISSHDLLELDNVRTVCNRINTTFNQARVVYYITDDKHVLIHVFCFIPRMTGEQEMRCAVENALKECFTARQFFAVSVDQLQEEADNHKVSDLEYKCYDNERIDELLAEAKFRPRDFDMSDPADLYVLDRRAYQLSVWLEENNLLPKTLLKWKSIESESDDGYKFRSTLPNQIELYFLLEPIVHKEGLDASQLAQHATIKLTYTRSQGNGTPESDGTVHTMIITLDRVAIKDNVAYVQVSALSPERDLTQDKSLQSAPLTARSMMVGYDFKTGEQRMAEVDYMWRDIDEKIAEGHEDELTDEQQLIRNVSNHDDAYDLYWGGRFLRQRRYYEAALHFQRVWNMYNSRYSWLEEKEKKDFSEVAYLLGASYMRLGRYREAYFYLQGINREGSIKYTTEFIRCLMAIHDCRAFEVVRRTLQSINWQLRSVDEEDELTEQYERLIDFRAFLQRCNVEISVRMSYLKDAAEDCNQMLHDERNAEFARKEMAHINALLEKGATSLPRPEEELPF